MIENTDLSSTDKLKALGKGQTKQPHKESTKTESSPSATIAVSEIPLEKESTKTESSPSATIAVFKEKESMKPQSSSMATIAALETAVEKIQSLPVEMPKKRERQKPDSPTPSRKSLKKREEAQMLRTRCKQLGLSLLFQGHGPVHSLGFTSAIQGEGKSFLAKLTAEVLAEDMSTHVVLMECNWENPSLDSAFNLSSGPGLAEWLQGKSSLRAIRRSITSNLTVIPAGEGQQDAIYLLRELHQRGIQDVLNNPDELLIVDLPATVTTSYGQYAAQLVDALLLVVRMGVTPETFVVEAHNQLKDLPVQGIVLNQIASRIPRWLRQLL